MPGVVVSSIVVAASVAGSQGATPVSCVSITLTRTWDPQTRPSIMTVAYQHVDCQLVLE